MTSTMKHGFSTLNRLLGKKPKDDVPVAVATANNGNTNGKTGVALLSRSMTNLDTTSQYNKIVPLAAMNNAPFEQTFRITVCLPRDQLFVARVGAKTKLEHLLEMTCTTKQLDRDKYEFRHPADNSQIFHNELTIGEVGLNEIRLVAKEDSDRNFNLDDLTRMRAGTRNSYAGQSTSSDQFQSSSRAANGSHSNGRVNSHHHNIMHRESTTKTSSTVSPYSSTNSLNSVDSSNSRGNHLYQQNQQPVAPMRKKRVAPRPPSQNSIPEHPPSTISKNHFHVSSPNLATNYLAVAAEQQPLQQQQAVKSGGDIVEDVESMASRRTSIREEQEAVVAIATNGGRRGKEEGDDQQQQQSPRPLSMNLATHLNGEWRSSVNDLRHSRTSSNASEFSRSGDGPEPVPRRKVNGCLKKKKAAPAPPPRSRENLTPTPPIPTPRTVTKVLEDPPQVTPVKSSPEVNGGPPQITNGNVSKVILNAEVVKKEVTKPDDNHIPVTRTNGTANEITISQNGDSPVSISVVEARKEDVGETLKPVEPSSDEDDEHQINIYNLKSGACVEAEILQDNGLHLSASQEKILVQELHLNDVVNETLVKTEETAKVNGSHKTNEIIINGNNSQSESPTVVKTTNRLDSPLDWTYTLPAPPNFADSNNNLMKKSPAIETATITETLPNNYVNYEDDEDNGTIRSGTTLVSDVIIKPVIKERIPMIEEPLLRPLELNNSNSESSDFNSSSTLTSGSAQEESIKYEDDKPKPKKLIINSDIEDGYHGDINHTFTQDIIETLEKRRCKYIENEFAMLTKVDDLPPTLEARNEDVKTNGLAKQSIMFGERDLVNGQSQEKVETVAVVNQTVSLDLTSLPIIRSITEETQKNTGPDLNDFKKPREYVRRSSSTKPIVKTVQRSDSFHSTRYQDNSENNSLVNNEKQLELSSPSRSSSYVSLLGAQKFEQRRNSFLNDLESSRNAFNRRASSELSISNTPSLQSLEVMKSILNSSKKNISGNTESQETKSPDPELAEPVETEEREVTKNETNKSSKENTKNEQGKKKWVYRGPPTINLGSWSERPKIQVCLKSDSDYRCGQTNGTSPIDSKVNSVGEGPRSLNVVVTDAKQEEPEKLPIVRAVELKKASPPPSVVESKPELPKSEPPKPNGVAYPEIPKKPFNRPLSVNLGATTSKFTPVVRGFQWMKDDSEDVKSTKINPVMARSYSTFDMKPNKVEEPPAVATVALKRASPPVTLRPQATPQQEENPFFSQITLRHTGLKEKILLAQQAEEKPVTKSVSKSVVDSPKPFVVSPPLIPMGRKVVESPLQQTAPPVPPVSSPPPPPPAAPALLNPLAQLSQPNNPLGNLRPIVRGVVAKRQIPSPEIDPRNQLLDSIRNFNFNSLRKM